MADYQTEIDPFSGIKFENKKGHDANLRQWKSSNSRKMIIEREFYILLPTTKKYFGQKHTQCALEHHSTFAGKRNLCRYFPSLL